MLEEEFQTRQKHNRQDNADGLQWVLLLASPFFIGLVFKIFPLDREFSIGVILASLGSIALLSLLPWRWRYAPFAGGVLVLVLVISIPFWALSSKGRTSGAPVRAVYSYKDAKANPEAFTKWWNFFVDEVVRTNQIIFERDHKGVPIRPKPNAKADFYKGNISINNQGYRGDNLLHEKKHVYRILTIGDSTTFGQTLFPDSRPWSAVLQDLISRDLHCSMPIQVVNGGVNGYHLRNGIDRVERDYAWLKPDMVVSYFGWNSTADMGVYPDVVPLTPLPTGASRLDLITWFVKKTVVSIRGEVVAGFFRVFSMTSEKDTDALMSKVRQGTLYRQHLELVEQSRRLGYKLLLLSFNAAVATDGPEEAKVFYEGAFPTVRTVIELIRLHNLMIQEIAAKADGVEFIDTGDHLYGRYDEDLFIDVVHFTTKGDALMAANVLKGVRPLLLRESKLDCRAAGWKSNDWK